MRGTLLTSLHDLPAGRPYRVCVSLAKLSKGHAYVGSVGEVGVERQEGFTVRDVSDLRWARNGLGLPQSAAWLSACSFTWEFKDSPIR